MVCPAVCVTHCLCHPYIFSILPFGDDKVYQVTVSGALVHPRRPISMGQAEYSARDEHFMFCAAVDHCCSRPSAAVDHCCSRPSAAVDHCCCFFRHRFFLGHPPRSMPTLALKSVRWNSLSCRGTDLINLSRSS